jgi:hypothetical protein
VRTSYSSFRQKTQSQDVVTYNSTDAAAALEQFYTDALAADGWEQMRRYEDDNGVGRAHQILLTWKQASRTAAITITQTSPANADIRITLTTVFPP